MQDRGVGDYFISDADDTLLEDDDLLGAPLVVPVVPRQAAQMPAAQPGSAEPQTPATAPVRVAPPMSASAVTEPPMSALAMPAPAVSAVPAASAVPASVPAASAAQAPVTPAAPSSPIPPGISRPPTREEQLVRALDELMHNDADIQAAALVSLDGFTMASALPAGMQSDRVGAMSAAILGLGERAAAELGRGHLSQVFIEGANGYVLLIAAGDRAVLTALAEKDSKLGLVLYDMKVTAESIGRILG